MSHLFLDQFLYQIERTQIFCNRHIEEMDLLTNETDTLLVIDSLLKRLYSSILTFNRYYSQEPQLPPRFVEWVQEVYYLLDTIRTSSSDFDPLLDSFISLLKQCPSVYE